MMPERIKSDVELLKRVPRVGHRYRTRPLGRIVRFWLRQCAEDAAVDAMTRHRSALRASKSEGVSYRRARKIQDMNGARLGRGPTWDRTP